jgi:hypothetical protein
MALHLPKRPYIKFDELIKRWACEPNDIRYAIATGSLKPSILPAGELTAAKWEDVAPPGAEEWVAEPLYIGGGPWRLTPRGWLYCQSPKQTGAYGCTFYLAADERDADVGELPYALWYFLDAPMSMADVERDAVFLLTEIARFESADANTDKAELGKRTKEHNTLLRIVYGMAVAPPYNFNSLAQRSEAAATISSATAAAGCLVSDETVRKYLKMASEIAGRANSTKD